MKKQIKMYLHGSKDPNMETWAEIHGGDYDSCEGDAYDNFKFALYEVEFDIEVDLDTGNLVILKITNDGRVFLPESKPWAHAYQKMLETKER